MKLSQAISTLSTLTRARDWRFSFVPFVMGCVYLWLVWFDIHFDADAAILVGLSLLTTFGFAAFGYFINEYFDREADKKAGKINKMEFIKPIYRFLLFMAILSVVFLPWLGLPSDTISYLLIVVEISLFLLYSLPFIRLKEKPLVAGVVDTLYAYVVPLLLSFHTYALYSPKPEFPYFLIFFLSAVFFIGYRNIAIHQVDDLFKDMRAGIRTLPQLLGPSRTNMLMRFLLVGEIVLLSASFIGLGFSVRAFWGWAPFFLVFAAYRCRTMKGHLNSRFFCIEPIRHATDMAHLVAFPVFVLVLLTIMDIRWGGLLVLHLLVMVPGYSLKWVRENVIRPIAIAIGYLVNHTIYYLFRIVGVDLVKERKSAFGYIKYKWFS